ncbi:hypothetical protein AWC38_SpisGene9986 [Stylophora pistillata]|uniref:RNA-directed DNA polymerase from mobile element jockey n=1 Tax=Stylophora pistillata TaxID=50429 RepID=A0A2B4S9Y7_STYPI|nr:hypothetical protein AWC38_SpisGene9986 [Stylophora pistillata]
MRTAVSASKVTHAYFRKLKAINKQQFLEDIRNSSLCRDPPTNTLDELVECYNNTPRSVLDKHAPVRARHLKSQSRPPWFNDEIVKARRERRSAERKWRAGLCRLTRMLVGWQMRWTSEADAVIAIEKCIRDVRAWMRDDKLMLNDDKSEFLIIGTERQLSKASVDEIKIGQAEVSPVSSVRNLGTWFDSHLDMSTHVTKACASAFYYLYSIQHIRKYLSRESTERLVHAFITSRLDYCNGLLYGAPEYQIKKLQRVMNASVQLVYCAPKYCHITPLLRELHRLPVRLRVDFKLLLVAFKYLTVLAQLS